MTDESASTFVVPPPSPELKRLESLLGEWRTAQRQSPAFLDQA
jgi:hypothetical protein